MGCSTSDLSGLAPAPGRPAADDRPKSRVRAAVDGAGTGAGAGARESGGDTGSLPASASASLTTLPPEVLLHVLSFLDTESLCAASRSCRSLWAVSADASLWRGRRLTVCSRPWPPRAPLALRTLRVCSYRWPSPKDAQAVLVWLAASLRSVHRLELVGRNMDAETLRACVRLCADAHELSLHDVRVQDAWLDEIRQLARLESVHIDWHTEISSGQLMQLSADFPSLTAHCHGALQTQA